MRQPIYARDLKLELLTDEFMGKGFVEKLSKSIANDDELIVGYFSDEWENYNPIVSLFQAI